MDYSSYLNITELLSLQKVKSDFKREELLFIITHQATELWLKSLLTEIDNLKKNLQAEILLDVIANLKRCLVLWDLMINQFSALKALSMLEFAAFRPFLKGASGAQSIQYRVLEVTLGITQPSKHIHNMASSDDGLMSHLNDNNLRELAYSYLHKMVSRHDSSGSYLMLNDVFHDLNKLCFSHKEVNFFVDQLIEFDEAFLRWKQEHLYVVKRMIGNKLGTGNSSSYELATKMDKTIFPELWQLRECI